MPRPCTTERMYSIIARTETAMFLGDACASASLASRTLTLYDAAIIPIDQEDFVWRNGPQKSAIGPRHTSLTIHEITNVRTPAVYAGGHHGELR